MFIKRRIETQLLDDLIASVPTKRGKIDCG